MDVSLTKGHHRHEGDSGVKSNRNITADRQIWMPDLPILAGDGIDR